MEYSEEKRHGSDEDCYFQIHKCNNQKQFDQYKVQLELKLEISLSTFEQIF
jgi:hypothetical protein